MIQGARQFSFLVAIFSVRKNRQKRISGEEEGMWLFSWAVQYDQRSRSFDEELTETKKI